MFVLWLFPVSTAKEDCVKCGISTAYIRQADLHSHLFGVTLQSPGAWGAWGAPPALWKVFVVSSSWLEHPLLSFFVLQSVILTSLRIPAVQRVARGCIYALWWKLLTACLCDLVPWPTLVQPPFASEEAKPGAFIELGGCDRGEKSTLCVKTCWAPILSCKIV